MARTAKTPVRARRAKAEVEQEFAGISRDVEAARESPEPKAVEAAAHHAEEVRKAVEGISVDAVVQRTSALGLEITRALSEVSGKLVEEVQTLASVREAVALERQELERLHKLDIAATALDYLVQDYARQKQQLEGEIASGRAAWEEEARLAQRER